MIFAGEMNLRNKRCPNAKRSTPVFRQYGVAPMAFLVSLGMIGCGKLPEVRTTEGSGFVVLKPLPAAPAERPRLWKVVHVPVFSSIYLGFDARLVDLAVILSIRNVSAKYPIVVHSARYYDSAGSQLREYVSQPSALAPMSTADFVIQRRDATGGPGTNFLVEWSSVEDVDEPVIEAVMIGQQGNAGISFTSVGRVLPKASAELRPSTPAR